MTSTLVTDAVLIALVIVIYKGLSLRPGMLQNIFEMVYEYTFGMTKDVADDRAPSIFLWFISFFLFIFFANILGLLPGYGAILFKKHNEIIPIFRVPSSDFNTTFALACISMVATHALSVRFLGIKGYAKHFLSLNPLLLFIGLLEFVSELTKLISFSFRLFGNIFAGEVVLGRISAIAAYIAPVPFLMLEVMVAFVQALVFAMLTMIFMSILTSSHPEGGES